MIERMTVRVKIKPYLRAFMLSVYGPDEPIYLPKRDKFGDLLSLLLSKPPKNAQFPDQEATTIEVIIPYFDTINVNSYNYLTEVAQKAFEKRVNQRFWVIFEQFMDECFSKGLAKSSSFQLFLEKYNIPESSSTSDWLWKEIYRSRKIQQLWPKRPYNFTKTNKIISQD